MNKPLNTRNALRAGRVAMPNGTTIVEFDAYLEAVQYVDKLVTAGFPAAMIAIVGSDLRTVERLRGRMSYARIAFSGAITGSWLGLFYSLFFGTSNSTATNSSIAAYSTSFAATIFIGAGIGMLVNILRFSLAKGRKSFVSASMVIAAKYEVVVPNELADKARQLVS